MWICVPASQRELHKSYRSSCCWMASGKMEEMSSFGTPGRRKTHRPRGCRELSAPPAVGHICSWNHRSALCSLCPVPPLSLHWQEWAGVSPWRTHHHKTSGHQKAWGLSLPSSNTFQFVRVLVFLVLLGLPKGCGERGKDVLRILTLLLWDLWAVISVPQLLSSPVEINDVHILKAVSREWFIECSFFQERWHLHKAKMWRWGPNLWSTGILYARTRLMLSVCYKG